MSVFCLFFNTRLFVSDEDYAELLFKFKSTTDGINRDPEGLIPSALIKAVGFSLHQVRAIVGPTFDLLCEELTSPVALATLAQLSLTSSNVPTVLSAPVALTVPLPVPIQLNTRVSVIPPMLQLHSPVRALLPGSMSPFGTTPTGALDAATPSWVSLLPSPGNLVPLLAEMLSSSSSEENAFGFGSSLSN